MYGLTQPEGPTDEMYFLSAKGSRGDRGHCESVTQGGFFN